MNRIRLESVIVCVFSPLLMATVPGHAAEPRPITDTVPVDNLIVYMARPYSGDANSATTQPSQGVSIAMILSMLNSSGLIPDEGQVFADIATALPLMGRYEHALVLLDVSSKVIRRPGRTPEESPRVSLRLRNMQAAIVFRTSGDDRPVLQQLNRIVGRYTNNQVAELTTEKANGFEYQRLVDERMPGWAIWEWGRLGDFYVVSFGAGSFQKIAKTYANPSESLTVDDWYRMAAKKTKADAAHVKWTIAFERIESRLNEVARGRHENVIAALSADHLSNDLWTVGIEGRALSCYRCYRRNGVDSVQEYSDPATFPGAQTNIVPREARHFAVIKVPSGWLVDNVPRAWLAAQSQQHIEEWTKIWERIEQEVGIDLSANLLNNVGEYIVLFDYPPHPLEIPLAYTMAIQVKNEKAVKVAVDAILSTWGQYLDDVAKRGGNSLMRVRVRRDDDEVWYLQAGILGPALKVTKGYVVISWSPQALRDALKAMGNPSP
ncbi:MAG: hypothetical protein KF841_08655 [Phycisphaerae bacterium]|nr:hypothetical protein [Phycisphaerae bacterium]